MNKQTFEIIDGEYRGPSEWEGDLDLRGRVEGDLDLRGRVYGGDLTSLGNLCKVRHGNLDLDGCENLTSLGRLKEVDGWLSASRCRSLAYLGDSLYVGHWCSLHGCNSLTSLEGLSYVDDWLGLDDCPNMTITKLPTCRTIYINAIFRPREPVDQKLASLLAMPEHEILNELLLPEVYSTPLFKNLCERRLHHV
jgi:hypothetical protein